MNELSLEAFSITRPSRATYQPTSQSLSGRPTLALDAHVARRPVLRTLVLAFCLFLTAFTLAPCLSLWHFGQRIKATVDKRFFLFLLKTHLLLRLILIIHLLMHCCDETIYAARASSKFCRGVARAGEGRVCERERESETLPRV